MYHLVVDLIAAGIGAEVPKTVRETVAAVEALLAKRAYVPEDAFREVTVTQAEVAKELRLDKATVSRRVREARQRGYLENHETRKGRQAQLVLGDPAS